MVIKNTIHNFCDNKHKKNAKKFLIGLIMGFGVVTLLGIVFFHPTSPLSDRKEGLQDHKQLVTPSGDPVPPPPEPYINVSISSPPGSLGFTSGTIRIVNTSFFWSFFENHSGWKLEYTSKLGDPWTDVTSEALSFETSHVFDGQLQQDYEKQIINFTAPYTGYYRLNYTINATISGYEFNASHHEYRLNVSIPNTNEFYFVYYNWSDIVQSGWNQYIIYSHGVTQDSHFYLQVDITSKISKNSFLSLDPNFGNTNTGENAVSITDMILGTEFTAANTGTFTSMSMYVDEEAGYGGNIKMAMYYSSN